MFTRGTSISRSTSGLTVIIPFTDSFTSRDPRSHLNSEQWVSGANDAGTNSGLCENSRIASSSSREPRFNTVKLIDRSLHGTISVVSASRITCRSDPGIFVGVGTGVKVGAAVGVGIAVGLGKGVGVGLGVGVGTGVGVAVGVGVGVGTDVGVGTSVEVGKAVGLGVGVGVAVATTGVSELPFDAARVAPTRASTVASRLGGGLSSPPSQPVDIYNAKARSGNRTARILGKFGSTIPSSRGMNFARIACGR